MTLRGKVGPVNGGRGNSGTCMCRRKHLDSLLAVRRLGE